MACMRPHVTVNCAMTADGKIAGKSRRQVRISSPEDLERVRQLRQDSDAILVGINTIIADDPHLTVKGLDHAQNPLRVVLDSMGRTPPQARVLDRAARTLIATCEECGSAWPDVEVVRCGKRKVDLRLLMQLLAERGVERLMVEGGGEIIWSFFEADLVDSFFVFVGSRIIGGRTAPSPVDGEGFADQEQVRLELMEAVRLGDGVLLKYEVIRDARR
jgi:2,5-diamino-6-(ribosylamino)-4(3H)-pyrimidinone 5'-phosphate reductase